jgi:hypothetical protein
MSRQVALALFLSLSIALITPSSENAAHGPPQTVSFITYLLGFPAAAKQKQELLMK